MTVHPDLVVHIAQNASQYEQSVFGFFRKYSIARLEKEVPRQGDNQTILTKQKARFLEHRIGIHFV